MSLWTDLLSAAAAGVRAKAEHEASAQAQRTAAANHKPCTPCAANAAIQKYRAELAARGAQAAPQRGRR